MRDTKDRAMIQGGSPARGPRSGFTLVELIYVVILLGILIGFGAPFIDVSRFRLNSAVMEVTTQLMSAQRYAVLRGHDVVISFDEDEKWMRIHLDANNDGLIQDDENTSVVQLGEGVTFGRAPGTTLSASTENVTFTQKQGPFKALTFHRNGSASEMGFIYLTFASSSLPKSNRAVEIVRSTAKVKCWSYRTDTWRETC